MAGTSILNPRINDIAMQFITRGGGVRMSRVPDVSIIEAVNSICARRNEKAPTHAKNIPKEKRE